MLIVKHDANKAGLHYDLRVKDGSKYLSWRLVYDAKKELSVKHSKDSIIAIRTNDHTKKDAEFIGEIPEGEYGAGTISKYQECEIEITKFHENTLVFVIQDGKFKDQKWALLHYGNKKEVWSLFRVKQEGD